jgi:hypothetical protein
MAAGDIPTKAKQRRRCAVPLKILDAALAAGGDQGLRYEWKIAAIPASALSEITKIAAPKFSLPDALAAIMPGPAVAAPKSVLMA